MAAGALTAWWGRLLVELESPLPPLSTRERGQFTIATVIASLTRFLSIARSPWDWDELLFMLGVRHYDVTQHHPHPPGFPAYIGAAKVVTLIGLDDFHALQLLNVIAAIALFPLAFRLARELRATFAVALSSALLLVFFPNVWFYGGTAFSDVPSLALLLGALVLLLRSVRDVRTFVPGCILLGVASSVRPQNLLSGAAIALVAAAALAVRRKLGTLVAGVVAGAAVIVVAFGVAAHLSGGWSAFRDAVHAHQQYITATDSFLSAARPIIPRVADDFFFKPYRALLLNVVIAVAAAGGLFAGWRRWKTALLLSAATFGPFCLLALLTLDHYSAGRFSIGWAPLVALLAAFGLSLLGRLSVATAALLALALAYWTWPALSVVGRTISPPVAAVIAAHAETGPVLVDERLGAFAAGYLSHERIIAVDGVPRASFPPRAALLEGAAQGQVFARAHDRLWDLARRRYFEATLLHLANVTFDSGWYGEEHARAGTFRWMRNAARITLPPARRGHLQIELEPARHGAEFSRIDIAINGRAVAQVDDGQRRVIEADVEAARGVELAIAADRTFAPGRGDPRLLGARIVSLVWTEKR